MNDDNRHVKAHTLSLALARQLRDAGLAWEPQWFDLFAVPDAGLDERIFVLSDMTIDIQTRQGWPAITFNGALEWSLDYIMQADVIWLPTESQLRHVLQVRLADMAQPAVSLFCDPDGYRCRVRLPTGDREFVAVEASDAYALALLHILQAEKG